jgi:hypothetical protein
MKVKFTEGPKGILQSMSPFLLHFIGNYPHYRLYMMWTGMVLVVASSLGAAFSTTVSYPFLDGFDSILTFHEALAGDHDTRSHVWLIEQPSICTLC